MVVGTQRSAEILEAGKKKKKKDGGMERKSQKGTRGS